MTASAMASAAENAPALRPAPEPDSSARHALPEGARAIALVQSSPLPRLVQQELERLILSGEIGAGSKLNEAAIAKSLGVSRGPVREAFRALEQSGLARLEKNRGVFVRMIDMHEADEIYQVRAVLDEWIGRELARNITPEQLKALRALVERMEKAASRNDVEAYYPVNLEFHDRLVLFAGNLKLLATYRRLVNELRLFRRTTLARKGTLTVSTHEHRAIVDAIAAGDPEVAGRALYDHVMASRDRMHKTRPAASARPAIAPAAAQVRSAASRNSPNTRIR